MFILLCCLVRLVTVDNFLLYFVSAPAVASAQAYAAIADSPDQCMLLELMNAPHICRSILQSLVPELTSWQLSGY
jgi:hypothetical protein